LCTTCGSIVVESQEKYNGNCFGIKSYSPNLRDDYRKEEISPSDHITDDTFEYYKKCIFSYNNGLDEACFIYLIKLINLVFDTLIDKKFTYGTNLMVEQKEQPLLSKIDTVSINEKSETEDPEEIALKSRLKDLVWEYTERDLIRDLPGKNILINGITLVELLLNNSLVKSGQNRAFKKKLSETLDNLDDFNKMLVK